MAYIGSERLFNITSKGDSAFIRYSAYADGRNYTKEWSAGQNYIGIATGQIAPTNRNGYTWHIFNPSKGEKGEKGETGKSAYEYAVERGYSGSEDDYAILCGIMDVRAIDAERAMANAQDAEGKAETHRSWASSYAEEAKTAKNEAQTAASNAETHRSWAQSYVHDAKEAADEAKEAADRAKQDVGQIVEALTSLRGSKSGATISMTDISQFEHTLNVKVRGKNLSAINELKLSGDEWSTKPCIYKGYIDTSMVLSWKQDYSTTGSGLFGVVSVADGSYLQYVGAGKEAGAHSAKINPFEGEVEIQILNWANATENLTDIQLEVGATATEYTPYISDFSTVKVKKLGKNLFNNAELGVITYTNKNGASETRNGYALRLPAGKYTFTATLTGAISNHYVYTFVNNSKGEYRGDALTLLSGASKNDAYITTETTLHPPFIYNVNDGDVIYISDTYTNSTLEQSAQKFDLLQMQIEVGTQSTDYEPYIEPIEYSVNADGTVKGVTSIYPTTTLMTDTAGAIIDCEYKRDINKAFEELTNAIISMGGNI